MPMSVWVSRHFEALALGAILGVAAALRVIDLGALSLWHDEWTTILLGLERTPGSMIRLLPHLDATRAPLHPLMLQGWMRVFGDSEAAARSLSAVCSLGAIALVFIIGRQAFDARVGLVGAWMMALNPLDVYHAREIRMYALLVLLTCACWSLLVSFQRSSGLVRRAAYSACLVALMYTHPLGGLMVAALGVGYLVLRAELRLSLGGWLQTQVVAALAVLPWVRSYLDHPPEIVRPFKLLTMLEWPEAFTGGRIESVAGGVVLIGIGLWAAAKVRPPQRRAALVLLVWFIVPTLLLLAYSLLAHPVFAQRRYLIFVAPAYLLLVARGMVALPRPAFLAVLAFTTVMTAQVLPRRVYGGQCRPDWRGAAAAIRRLDPNPRVVLLDRQGYKGPLGYYLGRQIPLSLVSEQLRAIKEAPESLDRAVWYVTRIEEGRPVMMLPRPLAERYVAEERLLFHELILSHRQLKPQARAAAGRDASLRR
jgi:mannosyltransferase